MKNNTLIWLALAFIGLLGAIVFLAVMNVILLLNPFTV